MISTVIFDIDDTLYGYQKADSAAFPALSAWAETHLGVEPERFHTLYWQAFDEQTRRIGVECGASHSRAFRAQILLEWLGQPLTLIPEMTQVYWSTLLDHMVPSPGVEDCLRALKARGLRLGLGTDLTICIQLAKLERLGLLPYFDFLVTSEEAGADKPSPRFFRLCQSKAQCPSEQCLFVGDNPHRDVAGALAAGMHAAWYRGWATGDAATPVPDGAHLLSDLAELEALCDRL
jgi:putative hydrolase of the HAD superfamily